MNKTNKKYLTWIIIIIVLIIAVSIISTALKPKDIQNSEGILGTQKPKGVGKPISNIKNIRESSSQQEFPIDPILINNPEEIINSLNQTKCSNLENEIQKTFCISGIDLIKKAIATKNINICFDSSYKVETISRIICQQKISGL